MYIRKSTRTYKRKTYTNHLLVESVQTAKGPRQRTICSLGSLEPAPAEDWLGLAHKLQSALQGQESLSGSSTEIQEWAEKARNKKKSTGSDGDRSTVTVEPDKVQIEQAREAGPVHVGHQLWGQLGMNRILQEAGLSTRACRLTEVMTLNRLICPSSEHAMPDWIRRTALGDILQEDFSELEGEALYRNLDRLHPNREAIERALAEKEKTLFNLDDTVYLYDLTSTYFEGQATANPQAKRGYSRDKRPDCKQVVVGLVVDRDGFPKAHEIFDGNTQDRRSLDQMLDALEKRTGKKLGATVIVDRGMAFEENLEQIRKRQLHYLVAGRQSERNQWLEELENDDGWEQVHRTPSPRNPFQKKTRVEIKRQQKGDIVYLLCRSEGREEKDRAIREKQETKLIVDLHRLQQRVAKGQLKKEAKIQRAIGRLLERYPRVARYYEISYDAVQKNLSWSELADKKDSQETRRQLCSQNGSTGSERGGNLAHLHSAHPGGGCLLRPQEPTDGAADFSSSAGSHPDPHFPLRAGLPSPGGHRAPLLAGRRAHLLGDHSRSTPNPSGDYHCSARRSPGPRTDHPQSHYPSELEHRQIYATLGIPAEVMQPVKAWEVSAPSDEKKSKS